MGIEIGLDEYTHALKLGQREVAELSARGKSTNPVVLDEILPDNSTKFLPSKSLVQSPPGASPPFPPAFCRC